jgi:ABC-2 type transport system ATP-binding protein
MIEVEHLTKRYGGFTAVNDISFSTGAGVTGFLGPNGAGKTTTMRMLTGYLPPTSGKASVAGFDVFNDSLQVRKRVGYLPESVPLYRDMSALAYLMYIAEIRGVKNRRDRALHVLGRVGLQDRADSLIRTLSKGMRQRVGLASTLLHDPDVLILDEPTIGLDPRQVLELRDLVRELGQRHTVLFSTHILSEAEQVCQNVVIINRGEIIAQGSPSALRGELERGGRVFARADVAAETLLPTVREIDGIIEVEISTDGVIATPATPEIDPRPAIARAIIGQGWNLLELRPQAVNLEEIFLELTRHEAQGAADEEAEAHEYDDDDENDEEVSA